MSNDPDIIEPTNHNIKYKNPYKVATVIAALAVVGMVGLLVYVFMDNSDKIKQIADLQAKITSMGENENRPTGNSVPDGTPKDLSNYLVFEKVGIAIPLSPEIKQKIKLTEIEGYDTYRIDVKKIFDYREQGYCGNGGSASIGTVAKKKVELYETLDGGGSNGLKEKSQWVEGSTIAKFEDDVVYPEEYVAFYNLDAVCYDLKEGGAERKKEVAKEVQEINDALEEAFLNAVPLSDF